MLYAFLEGVAAEKQHAVGAAQILKRLARKAAPFQPNDVEADEARVIADRRSVGNDVGRYRRAPAYKCVLADSAILVDGAKSAEKRVIANADMAADRCAVRQNHAIADLTVMRHMGADHEESVGADTGKAAAGDGAAMHCDMLANDIVGADNKTGSLALAARMLRRAAENGERMDACARADFGVALDDGVALKDDAVTQFGPCADAAIRADRDVADLCAFFDNGCRVQVHLAVVLDRLGEHGGKLRFCCAFSIDRRDPLETPHGRAALDRADRNAQLVARNDRAAEAGPVDTHEKHDFPLDVEFFRIRRERRGRLGHRLDDHDAGHYRFLREMPLEELLAIGDVFDPDGALAGLDIDQPVDQQHRIPVRKEEHQLLDLQYALAWFDFGHGSAIPFLRQFRQRRGLPQPVFYRTRRDAAPFLAGRDIAHQARRRRDLGACADLQVVGEADLPAHQHAVSDDATPGYAGLSGDNAASPEAHVVADLDEIVDLAAVADDRIVQRPAIDRGVGPDLDARPDDHPPELRHFQRPVRAGCESEAVLADAGARQHAHSLADQRMGDDRVRFDDAAGADDDARTDIGVMTDPHIVADFRRIRHEGGLRNSRAGGERRLASGRLKRAMQPARKHGESGPRGCDARDRTVRRRLAAAGNEAQAEPLARQRCKVSRLLAIDDRASVIAGLQRSCMGQRPCAVCALHRSAGQRRRFSGGKGR